MIDYEALLREKRGKDCSKKIHQYGSNKPTQKVTVSTPNPVTMLISKKTQTQTHYTATPTTTTGMKML